MTKMFLGVALFVAGPAWAQDAQAVRGETVAVDEPSDDDVQAATLWLCSQEAGGTNVAPGTLVCTSEYVAADCASVGYNHNDPIQTDDGWIYWCENDPPATTGT